MNIDEILDAMVSDHINFGADAESDEIFRSDKAEAKAQLQALIDAELMKLKVKHATELSILDQEITSLKAEVLRGRIDGIKLVDKALLNNVTGSYPVLMVRNLIKLLVWENTPAKDRTTHKKGKI